MDVVAGKSFRKVLLEYEGNESFTRKDKLAIYATLKISLLPFVKQAYVCILYATVVNFVFLIFMCINRFELYVQKCFYGAKFFKKFTSSYNASADIFWGLFRYFSSCKNNRLACLRIIIKLFLYKY